jgi:hypothetical protein
MTRPKIQSCQHAAPTCHWKRRRLDSILAPSPG